MTEEIYPKLESFQTNQIDQNYRIKYLQEIKTAFENEIEQRRKFGNRYKRMYNFLENFNVSTTVISMGTGITGVALLTTIVGTPICIGLEITAFVCGFLGIASSVGCKKLIKKLEKHKKVCAVAIAKLNTVADLVSRALDDGNIDAKEFKLICDEHDKYITLKNDIRRKTREDLANQKIDIETLKKDFLEKGKQLGKKEMLEKLK